jgi:hypothetical protein
VPSMPLQPQPGEPSSRKMPAFSLPPPRRDAAIELKSSPESLEASRQNCLRCRTFCVALCDAIFALFFVIGLIVTMFFLGWGFLVYLFALVVVTILLIPATLCTDNVLPTADSVLSPFQWLMTRPSFYLNKWHSDCKRGVRECMLPPSKIDPSDYL